MYNWSTLLYSRNEQNTVNQLYLNKISFLKRMKQNEQKEDRDAKEDCASYCGSLGNPGHASVRKASVFPAA